MRSTLAIICAVKDCEPVTEEELRLALVAESSFTHSYRQEVERIIQFVDDGASLDRLKFHLELWKRTSRESLFAGHKVPVDEWLGAENTPGTPENNERMRVAKNIFKAATGQDL